LFLPSARWDALQCIVKVVDTYNANAGAGELHPAHNHCTRSTDDEEVRSQKPWRLLFPHNQYMRRRSEVDSNANPLSSIRSRSKSISLPPLPPVHFSVGEFQVESHSEDSSSRNSPKTRAVNLPQPYARFWLWRFLRPQPLCAMLS
jgi:hypothetical protein